MKRESEKKRRRKTNPCEKDDEGIMR